MPNKMSLPVEKSGPLLIHGSLESTSSYPERHVDRLIRLAVLLQTTLRRL